MGAASARGPAPYRGDDCIRHMPDVSRIRKNGAASYAVIPKHIMRRLDWANGDFVVIREAGDKLILERVPLEKLARIRTGEQEVRS